MCILPRFNFSVKKSPLLLKNLCIILPKELIINSVRGNRSINPPTDRTSRIEDSVFSYTPVPINGFSKKSLIILFIISSLPLKKEKFVTLNWSKEKLGNKIAEIIVEANIKENIKVILLRLNVNLLKINNKLEKIVNAKATLPPVLIINIIETK